MDEFVFISEILNELDIQAKLSSLSKKLKGKKVVLFGANHALDAILTGFDLNKYFDIIGICDDVFTKENVFEYKGFKIVSLQNLYFAGADVVINLKSTFDPIEKKFRKDNLIKKKVKVIHLLEKSHLKKIQDFYTKTTIAFDMYKYGCKFFSVLKDFYELDDIQIKSKLNYKKVIERIKNQKTPIRVLFLVQSYKNWTAQILYDKLKADEAFKVLPIVALPASLDEKAITDTETIDYFNSKNMECIDGYEYETSEIAIVKAIKPDIVFYQQPQFLKSDVSPAKVSEYALTALVPSAFCLKENCFESNFLLNRLSNTWKIFADNECSFKDFKNVDVVGFTGYELYKDEILSDKQLWANSSNLSNNRIVYAPGYSINNKFNLIKFKEQLDFFLNFTQKHPQYSFAIAPNPDLKTIFLQKKIFSNDDFENIKNKWQSVENVTIASENRFEIFQTSDLMITDDMNSLSEFFKSGNPIIYLYNFSKNKLNVIGEKMFKSVYKINTTQAIEVLLEEILIKKDDYNSKNRNTFLSKNHELFDVNVSDRIIKSLKQTFELENI